MANDLDSALLRWSAASGKNQAIRSIIARNRIERILGTVGLAISMRTQVGLLLNRLDRYECAEVESKGKVSGEINDIETEIKNIEKAIRTNSFGYPIAGKHRD